MVHQTMKINASSANSASNSNKPIGHFLSLLGSSVSIIGLLASCAQSPPLTPAEQSVAVPASATAGAPTIVVRRNHSRWVATSFADLPGWESDRQAELWTPLLRGCDRPLPGWETLCAQARTAVPPATDAAARAWFQQRMQPYRVESLDGAVDGLITGYFEPLVEASRVAKGAFQIPLSAAPLDLATRRPYWTRQQLDTLPAAQASLKGRAIAFVADPLDALVLQVQGSGRLRITEPDGSSKLVRIAFAGHNDQPYKSVARWLVDQGEMRLDQASWPTVKAWAQLHPQRLNEMLWANPRVVFFREEPMPNPELGPTGAQGVPLTPGRSVAVDRDSIPYGTPVWLDTTEPLTATPLRRAAMAQDTGTAITGAVRADYFWGWGSQAEQQAGRMKQPLRLWALWPVNERVR
jgi:membrane-bound lytic murein transglycosylase A